MKVKLIKWNIYLYEEKGMFYWNLPVFFLFFPSTLYSDSLLTTFLICRLSRFLLEKSHLLFPDGGFHKHNRLQQNMDNIRQKVQNVCNYCSSTVTFIYFLYWSWKSIRNISFLQSLFSFLSRHNLYVTLSM